MFKKNYCKDDDIIIPFFYYTSNCSAYPERVDSLMLINTQTTKAGWMEWGYQKRNVSHLRYKGLQTTKAGWKMLL